MEALVLERQGKISLRDIALDQELGPRDVRIAVNTVGICGSDIHYYEHGRIGPFVLEEPMVLGHEASGVVVEVGERVTRLAKGERVCMEPGIPDPNSRASRLGLYNLDPAVRFWATPPMHGCLARTVVHPEDYVFRLPENVSFAEGALVEPLAVGLHGAVKADIRPGDVGLVTGAGTIGIVTALSALAGGCSKVILSDVQAKKLEIASGLGPIVPVDVTRENLTEVVLEQTDGWGADILFEASGSPQVAESILEPLCPGGRIVYIGIPGVPVPLDVAAAQTKEISIATVFRYAHVYPRALALMGSGRIDLKPLVTDVYAFEDGVKAFDYARNKKPSTIKVQITLD